MVLLAVMVTAFFIINVGLHTPVIQLMHFKPLPKCCSTLSTNFVKVVKSRCTTVLKGSHKCQRVML